MSVENDVHSAESVSVDYKLFITESVTSMNDYKDENIMDVVPQLDDDKCFIHSLPFDTLKEILSYIEYPNGRDIDKLFCQLIDELERERVDPAPIKYSYENILDYLYYNASPLDYCLHKEKNYKFRPRRSINYSLIRNYKTRNTGLYGPIGPKGPRGFSALGPVPKPTMRKRKLFRHNSKKLKYIYNKYLYFPISFYLHCLNRTSLSFDIKYIRKKLHVTFADLFEKCPNPKLFLETCIGDLLFLKINKDIADGHIKVNSIDDIMLVIDTITVLDFTLDICCCNNNNTSSITMSPTKKKKNNTTYYAAGGFLIASLIIYKFLVY
jgi:hypothetical protein